MSQKIEVQPGDVIESLRRQLSEAHFELALSRAAAAEQDRRHTAETQKLLDQLAGKAPRHKTPAAPKKDAP